MNWNRRSAFLVISIILASSVWMPGVQSQGPDVVVVVQVTWDKVELVSKTSPTLQVVVNPMIRRGSPIHNAVFSSLQALNADHVRFVPWLPYPRLAVAELEAPTGNPHCATISDQQTLFLSCYEGRFSSIDFASYGTPTGQCGNYSVSKCNSPSSVKIIQGLCLGKQNCSIPVSTDLFGGDPCYGTHKHFSVQATCSPSTNKTSWDFTLLDPLMEDFMAATKGHSVIINFSTIPQWMWNTAQPVLFPSDPDQVFWSYEQGTELRDPSCSEVSQYYARLVSWYTRGGFTDEYGAFHSSGYKFDIPYWEVLNEVDYEHSMTPQSYTILYDAIVKAIKTVQPNMKFVGMALAGHPELDWFEYFLNSSNHQANVPLDWISYHFYASSASRTNPQDYLSFFPQADGFLSEVQLKQEIRNRLSPSTKTTIDEVGVILPNDNDPDPAALPNIYWNAAGAMYAYLFSNLAKQGIEVIGESQLVGYPSQFPSVTMIDWVTGSPNARYWVLKLLLDNFNEGDKMVTTSSSDSNIFAQGYSTINGQRKVLLVNKSLQSQSVEIAGSTGATVEYVDETTNFNPPNKTTIVANTFNLNAFGVAVVTL